MAVHGTCRWPAAVLLLLLTARILVAEDDQAQRQRQDQHLQEQPQAEHRYVQQQSDVKDDQPQIPDQAFQQDQAGSAPAVVDGSPIVQGTCEGGTCGGSEGAHSTSAAGASADTDQSAEHTVPASIHYATPVWASGQDEVEALLLGRQELPALQQADSGAQQELPAEPEVELQQEPSAPQSNDHAAGRGADGQPVSEVTELVGHAEQAAQMTVPAHAAVSDLQLNGSDVRRQLRGAQQLLFNASRRNVSAAVQQLRELSTILDRVMPAAVRRAPWRPEPAPSQGEAEGAEATASEVEVAGGAVVLPGVFPSLPGTLLSRARDFNGTGIDSSAKALFTLAALQAYHLLDASQSTHSRGGGGGGGGLAAALVSLHRAAMGGSMEAMYSLIDRYAHGHGVPQNETVALQYARLAGQWLVEHLEATQEFSAPMAPLDLRESWIDRRYIAPEEAENADRVLALEEDMAMRGNVDAQRRLAYRRLLGRGIEADPEGAFRDFEAAAAQGDAYAMFNLGYMYLRGLFVAVNNTRAKELFEQAAAKNLPSAYSGLGTLYWSGQAGEQNMTLAFEAYLKGAALNNSDSMYNLGIIYLHGLANERNETRAFEYFQQADATGHWKASATLATLYETGTGVEKNATLALRHFRKLFKERASWTELVSAAAEAHHDGNHQGALAQLIMAAEQGSDTAAVNAAWMVQQGLGYTGPKALDLAARLYERAARQGNAAGAVELAHMLYHADDLGLSRHRNLSEVFFWYQQAAAATTATNTNSTEGLYYLGWAHHHGVGTERNLTAAAELYNACLKAAGGSVAQMPRMVAPSLGLLTMWLDGWLEPLLGADVSYRAAMALQHRMLLRPGQRRMRASAGVARHPAVDAGFEGAEGASQSGWQAALVSATQAMQGALPGLRQLLKSDLESLVMVGLLVALAAVLGIRHQQRVRLSQAQLPAATQERTRHQAR